MQDPKIVKNSPSEHQRTTLSGYIFATKAYIGNRKSCKTAISPSQCSHNMVNFDPLAANIFSLVWGTPANFNGFRVLVSLLQRRRWTEANKTLRNVWPSVRLVHYIYTFGGSCLVTKFCQVQHLFLCLSLALSYFGSVTARHSSSDRQPNFAALNRGRHL